MALRKTLILRSSRSGRLEGRMLQIHHTAHHTTEMSGASTDFMPTT
jgi:hypothetical protein